MKSSKKSMEILWLVKFYHAVPTDPPMIPRNLQHFASSNRRQVIAFVTEEARHAATLEARDAWKWCPQWHWIFRTWWLELEVTGFSEKA